jgi:hypothetical protein
LLSSCDLPRKQDEEKRASTCLNCSISQGVRKLADRTKQLVSARMRAFNKLCGFMTLYLFNLASMSELARIAPWTFSVFDLDRAISGFDGNRFMRRLCKSIPP